MQVDQDAGVTTAEVHVLWEEHRGVAMGVEGQYMMMQALHLLMLRSLVNEPLKDRQATLAHTFGMPLHTHDRLELRALHRLNHTIGSFCHHPQTGTRLAYGLMMEGIDVTPTAVYII